MRAVLLQAGLVIHSQNRPFLRMVKHMAFVTSREDTTYFQEEWVFLATDAHIVAKIRTLQKSHDSKLLFSPDGKGGVCISAARPHAIACSPSGNSRQPSVQAFHYI
jgi:hypothetical protein